MANTGYKRYQNLEQYNVGTGDATGLTKPNTVGDPDYAPPVYDPINCAVPPITVPTVNKVQMKIINQGGQFINFPALTIKPWNASAPSQMYYSAVYSTVPGETRNFIDPPIQQIGDWLVLQINAGNFSKGLEITISIYFTNSAGRLLRGQLQLQPNSSITSGNIPIPRTAAGGTNLIEVIIEDVQGPPPTPNIPPTANAGSDKTITLPENAVILDGSGSADSDGTIIGYQWQRVSGPLIYTFDDPLKQKPFVGPLVAGVYVFKLTVTDDKGATASDTVTITVNSTESNDFGVVTVLVDSTLTGSAITDIKFSPVGTSFTYQSIINPVTPTNSPFAFQYFKDTYNVEVVVSGTGGSIRINQGTQPVICQPYTGPGSYVFQNLVVDEGIDGLTISLTAASCGEQGEVVYAKLTLANTQRIEEALAPKGKRIADRADIIVKFYSDSAATTPVNANLVLNYRIQTVDNMTSTTSYVNYNTGVTAQNQVQIGGDTTRQEWDYTLNDPDVQEVNDKTVDQVYTYTLLPGVGYNVI